LLLPLVVLWAGWNHAVVWLQLQPPHSLSQLVGFSN
jgi:hypothetical protein